MLNSLINYPINLNDITDTYTVLLNFMIDFNKEKLCLTYNMTCGNADILYVYVAIF